MFKQWFRKVKKSYNALPVVVHPLFLLFGIYCIAVGLWQILLCYTMSAVLHEFGHFIVAKRCGYKMVQLRLMPYGAELSGELDQFIYNDEIKIAVAGPLTSLVVAVLMVSLWWVIPSSYVYTYDFCISNLVCAIFNILPIYPLDGGRVFVAMLSKKLRRSDAVRYAKMATMVFSMSLFALFILSCFFTYNLSFGLVSIMLFASSLSVNKSNAYFRISTRADKLRYSKKGFEVVEIVINKNVPLYKIYSKLKTQKFYRFLIVDDNMSIKGIVDESVFDNASSEFYKMTFNEILLLNYNKNINLYR